MFYLKAKIDNHIEIKVDIYGDEIFTTCFICGKEIQADEKLLVDIFKDGGDFASTSISCGCMKK